MRSLKTGRKTSSVASTVWHVALSVETKCCQYPLLQFLWTKIRSTWPGNNRYWLYRLLLADFRRKINWSIFLLMRAGFLYPKRDNLLVYIPAKIKMSFIWKDDFLPKSASSVSRSQAHFPSIVQAYTQPYSFGGRIKLIICQIRHELRVTIHEITTSWNKKR